MTNNNELELRMQKNQKINTLNGDIPILPISSIAITLNVTQRTLRIYDKEGILSPTRTAKNRRNYTLNDLEKGKLIQFLTKNLALNLSGVKLVLAFLETNKVKPQDYLEYVNKIAKIAKIDDKTQDININKTSKRGRKPAKSQ